MATAGAFTSAIIDALMLHLKNPAFHDEHEWRLVCTKREYLVGMGAPQTATAVSGHYIKPYVEVRFLQGHDKPSKPPISAIICGPRLESSLAESGVRELLACHGYHSNIEVRSSELREALR